MDAITADDGEILLERIQTGDEVQALARHEDLKTTQRYADLDADDLRSAIERLDAGENRGDSTALTRG